MGSENAEPLRRDAARNREAVLAAARKLAAANGLALRHADVARAAGVGMGTVYRRFPTREDLLEALFAEHIKAVASCAIDALDEPTGWAGLQRFMTDQLELQASDRGLRELLRDANSHPFLARSAWNSIAPSARELLVRAHREGSIPPWIAEGDLVTVHLMVTGLMDAAGADAPELWRRSLAIAMNGLQTGPELPGSPLAADIAQRIQGRPAASGSRSSVE